MQLSPIILGAPIFFSGYFSEFIYVHVDGSLLSLLSSQSVIWDEFGAHVKWAKFFPSM